MKNSKFFIEISVIDPDEDNKIDIEPPPQLKKRFQNEVRFEIEEIIENV